MCAVLNGANEVAVDAFLDKRLGFTQIGEVIQEVMARHKPVKNPEIVDIVSVAAWARQTAEGVI